MGGVSDTQLTVRWRNHNIKKLKLKQPLQEQREPEEAESKRRGAVKADEDSVDEWKKLSGESESKDAAALVKEWLTKRKAEDATTRTQIPAAAGETMRNSTVGYTYEEQENRPRDAFREAISAMDDRHKPRRPFRNSSSDDSHSNEEESSQKPENKKTTDEELYGSSSEFRRMREVKRTALQNRGLRSGDHEIKASKEGRKERDYLVTEVGSPGRVPQKREIRRNNTPSAQPSVSSPKENAHADNKFASDETFVDGKPRRYEESKPRPKDADMNNYLAKLQQEKAEKPRCVIGSLVETL